MPGADAAGASTVLFAGPSLPLRHTVCRPLEAAGLRETEAAQVRDLSRMLREQQDISVVVCPCEFDGTPWRRMLEICRQAPSKPAFILVLTGPCRPELWAEAMLAGACAVCTGDMNSETVERLVKSAHQRWIRQRQLERARSENLIRVAAR